MDAQPPPPEFGAACVACGAPAATTSTLKLDKLVPTARGTQRTRGVTWPIPHCAACARVTESTFLAAFVPFAIGFHAVGGLAFVPVAYGALVTGVDGMPDVAAPRTPA